MAHITQSPMRLNGVDYGAGEVVPDDAASPHLLHAQLLVSVPDEVVASRREADGPFDPTVHSPARVLTFVERYPARTEEILAAEEGNPTPRASLVSALEDWLLTRPEPAPAAVSLPDSNTDDVDGDRTTVPEPGVTAAAGATSGDLGPDVVDEMRAAAGTDPAGQPNPSAPVPSYDPGAHTTLEVLAYVDEHPDRLIALADAERAGKNRKGLLEDLARRHSASSSPDDR
jgi:hypothetical protein